MVEPLPQVLSGPILRRCSVDMATVWLATNANLDDETTLAVYDCSGTDPRLIPTTTEKKTVHVGANLFVHLLIARPQKASFPQGVILGYEVFLSVPYKLDFTQFTYGRVEMPTFFLQRSRSGLRMMHGSCRRPYAAGLDSLAAADTLIGRDPRNLNATKKGRPAILILTGDQIYADDIDADLFAMVQDVAYNLMGYQEEIPRGPNISVKLASLKWGEDRKDFVNAKVHFPTEDGQGHLLGLGEFAAMYILNWNQAAWPRSAVKSLPSERWNFKWPCGDDPRKRGARVNDLYRTLPAVQRALANVPTYMIFDDHDVTDDWNIDIKFFEDVWNSPSGRRAVANALAAYWLFQGWGNDPDRFEFGTGNPLRSIIQEFCDYQMKFNGGISASQPVSRQFETDLWQFNDWMFTVPTDPITIFADTRTNRDLFSRGGIGPILINQSGRKKLKEVAKQGGFRNGKPIIIVSAAPVFGLLVMELGQSVTMWLGENKLRWGDSAVNLDREQWRNNQAGLAAFLRFIIDQLAPQYCVFLSGDVHYGFSAGVDYFLDPIPVVNQGRYGRFVQLTSSALKNESKKAGNMLVMRGLTDLWGTRIDVRNEDWSIADEASIPPKWLEFGKYFRDDGGEAAAPIQGRSNLGVVTILPGATTIQHDFCQIYEESTTMPKLVELSAQIPVQRELSKARLLLALNRVITIGRL